MDAINDCALPMVPLGFAYRWRAEGIPVVVVDCRTLGHTLVRSVEGLSVDRVTCGICHYFYLDDGELETGRAPAPA